MITNRIYEWARTQPAKTAMIHNDHMFSYAVFARAIGATKAFFEKQTLPIGRTAIVCASNLADAWIYVLGLRSIGLNTICVSSLAAAKALNVRDVACIVVTEAERAAHKLEEQIWTGTTIIAVPRALYANVYAGDSPRPMHDTSPFGGHILYTSGTTGSYKKVIRDGATEQKRNAYQAKSESFDSDTVHFVANFGPWTAAGFYWPSTVWHAGGCVVFNQSPETFLRSFQHGITSANFIPPMLRAFLNIRDGSAASVRRFRLVVGGGFVPLDLAKMAADQLTTNVTIMYGATEHSSKMRSRFRTSDDLHWLLPDVDGAFEIVDDSGRECTLDNEGELRVRLRDIDTTSYLDDEEASSSFFRGSYFYPGDMAVRRADGRIRILGRVADVLNLQGQKIAVTPIEQKVQNLLGVNAACLFSLLSGDGKEELVVAIETSKAPPQFQLDKISHEFKSFGRVRFEFLQEFPRTKAGMQKIKRTELRRIIVGKGVKAGGGLD
jgi:acyl-coenzyme A synthetase/AMP-(fatty) acid ligase